MPPAIQDCTAFPDALALPKNLRMTPVRTFLADLSGLESSLHRSSFPHERKRPWSRSKPDHREEEAFLASCHALQRRADQTHPSVALTRCLLSPQPPVSQPSSTPSPPPASPSPSPGPAPRARPPSAAVTRATRALLVRAGSGGAAVRTWNLAAWCRGSSRTPGRTGPTLAQP